MGFNPIKEQRKISKKYIIGYYSSDSDFEKKLKEHLSSFDITIELININSLQDDTLNLIFPTLDELIIDSEPSDRLTQLLQKTETMKPFCRLLGITNIKQLEQFKDLDIESHKSTDFSLLSNSIVSRSKLVLSLKSQSNSSREKDLRFIMQLVSILENKDPYTKDHSARVAKYSVAIAEEYFTQHFEDLYGSTKTENPEIYEESKHKYVINQMNLTMLAAWAHDLGKNSIASDLLSKDSILTKSEYDIVKMHTDFGAQMIRKLLGDEELAEAIENHHERIDGNGYHSKEEFSDVAKIIAIADSFDAMTTTRPYTTKVDDGQEKKKIKTLSEAITELQICSHYHMDIETNRMSQQLDTTMSDIFVKLLKKELELIQDGKTDKVTLLAGGLDENGYLKAGFWDDKTQLYSKDLSVSDYKPNLLN